MTRPTRPAPPPPVTDRNPPRPPRPAPPEPDHTPEPPAASPPAIREPDPTDTLLASKIASNGQTTPGEADMADSGSTMLLALAKMRTREVDPMADYVGDGTRKLRFVQDAINLYASLTGTTRQEVETAIFLGRDRLPEDALDAAYLNLYKRPRPRD